MTPNKSQQLTSVKYEYAAGRWLVRFHANVVAAVQVAKRLGPEAKVVTLMADSGLKYLNTDVYRSR
jgi:hypothetical protein